MKNEFVPFELAVKLKELGFEERCFTRYYESGKLADSLSYLHHNYFGQVNAPTFSQAFRWFKKKYGIFVSIVPKKYGSLDSFMGWIYIPLNGTTKDIDVGGRKGYNTPEEAELACIDKLIELVKTKKEK
jgi:hypothetical protein